MKNYLKPILEILNYQEDVIRTSEPGGECVEYSGGADHNDCFNDENWD